MLGLMKVLIIGLDGATWNVLRPLMRKGILPTIKKLAENGVTADLESTIPPVTGAAWPAIATGRGPGKTGIVDHLKRVRTDTYDLRPISSRDIRGRAFWDYLSASGYRVGIFNFPLLYPPYKVNGFMVSGLGSSPEQEISYPPSLQRELEEVTGGYQIHVSYREEKYDDVDLLLKDLNSYFDKFERAVRYVAKMEWDMLFLVVSATDWIQHSMWRHIDERHPLYDPANSPKYRKGFEEFWSRVDKLIGDLIRIAGDDTIVFVVSDHGFGPADQTFNLFRWLESKGYIVRKRSLRAKVKKVLYKLLIFARKIGVKRLVPYKTRRSIVSKVRTSIVEEIDLHKSKAICIGHTIGFGAIYVNVGDEASRAGVLESIIKDLENLPREIKGVTKTTIYKPREMYRGDRVELLPDLIFTINDWRCCIVESEPYLPLFENRSISPRRTGSHRPIGVFIAFGPKIKKGCNIGKVKVFDIAPTVLHIFRLPIPSDIDGRVLSEIFEENSEFKRRKPFYLDLKRYESVLKINRIKRKILGKGGLRSCTGLR